jgi:prepilin-type N-terminal cleavage/methylation domain-containing protein/prepilin-type processing-associated H-X9-DG protein
MLSGRSRKQGFTLIELLVVIAIIALLAAILLPVLQIATGAGRGALCKKKENNYFLGIRFYLNSYGEFFPLAWLESSNPDPRLGKLSYWRINVHEQAESGFKRHVDLVAKETAKMKFDADKVFWSDSAKGYTKDYFGPILIFKGFMTANTEIDTTQHDSDTNPYDRHAHYTSVVRPDVGSSIRPVITDVDASFPDPEVTVSDTKNKSLTTGHGKDLQGGWNLARVTAPSDATSIDLFIGVSRSQRQVGGDYSMQNCRFDYRHNGAANVSFLDGHVIELKEDNSNMVVQVNDCWNKLDPWTKVTP